MRLGLSFLMRTTRWRLPEMKVSFFATCLADNVVREIAINSVLLLERLGCRVTFNPDQTCCGQPLANSGYHERAK